MIKLRSKYSFGKVERESFLFTGLNISQNESGEITLHQKNFNEKLDIQDNSAEHPEEHPGPDDNRLIRKTQGKLSWLS